MSRFNLIIKNRKQKWNLKWISFDDGNLFIMEFETKHKSNWIYTNLYLNRGISINIHFISTERDETKKKIKH